MARHKSRPAANATDTAAVKSLRQLRSRRERDRTGTFYIEGNRIVAQALASDYEIVGGVIAPDLLAGGHAHETATALQASGAPVTELSRQAFESISYKENLQGIGAVLRARLETLDPVVPSSDEFWMALDNVGNSGNLGAILRTCDAVGCAGIILLGHTTDAYHPAAVRASMGAVFAQRLVRAEFDEFMAWKQTSGCHVVGTSGGASQPYRELTYPRPCILLMGSERLGLTEAQQAACDQVVSIPMIGTGDSLNLGVAASILLYEVFHQRHVKGSP